MKYRTRPEQIDAIQFDGKNFKDIEIWSGHTISKTPYEYLLIRTTEGILRVEKHDFIINKSSGGFRTCKPDVFKKEYELAKD